MNGRRSPAWMLFATMIAAVGEADAPDAPSVGAGDAAGAERVGPDGAGTVAHDALAAGAAAVCSAAVDARAACDPALSLVHPTNETNAAHAASWRGTMENDG